MTFERKHRSDVTQGAGLLKRKTCLPVCAFVDLELDTRES